MYELHEAQIPGNTEHLIFSLKKHIDWFFFLERGRGMLRERERRETETLICCSIYLFTHWCFLYVSWWGIEPQTLVYQDATLANWAAHPGSDSLLLIMLCCASDHMDKTLSTIKNILLFQQNIKLPHPSDKIFEKCTKETHDVMKIFIRKSNWLYLRKVSNLSFTQIWCCLLRLREEIWGDNNCGFITSSGNIWSYY